MQNKNSSFKIGMEDTAEEMPSPFIRTAREGGQIRSDMHRLEKINRRLTLLALLLPLLMAVSLYALYTHIGKKIETSANSDAQIQSVSNALDAKFAELTARYEEMEKNLNEKEEPLKEGFLVFEQTAAGLNEKLGELEKELAVKADKNAWESRQKELTAQLEKQAEKRMEGIGDSVSELAQKIAPLQETVEKMREELNSVKEQFLVFRKESEKLKNSINRPDAELTVLKEELTRLQSEIVEVLSETIDRKSLNTAIANQHKEYRKEMDFIINSLNEKDRSIRTVQKQMRELESRVKKLSRKPLGTPEPGSILEQDLQ